MLGPQLLRDLQALQSDGRAEPDVVRAIHHSKTALGDDPFHLVRAGDDASNDSEDVVRHFHQSAGSPAAFVQGTRYDAERRVSDPEAAAGRR